MGAIADEQRLAETLCRELLSAADLKVLCQARGFPTTGSGKEALAAAAGGRFLEPLGVAEAMAGLEGRWLVALHLVAASRDPLPVGDLRSVLEPGKKWYHVDLRALWRKLTSELLAKGVLLADEEGPDERSGGSRYARFRLRLPEAFRRFLPPFPIPVEEAHGAAKRGNAAEMQRRALLAFLEVSARSDKKRGSGSLVERLAGRFHLKDGLLRMEDSSRDPEEVLAAAWEAGLEGHGRDPAPLAAGRMASHILAHLPPGRGCRPLALTTALGELGIKVPEPEVLAFCEEGVDAGLVERYAASGGGPIFAAARVRAKDTDVSAAPMLFVSPHGKGVRVDLERSAVDAVLEAAAVAQASIEGAQLTLAPDLVRLGRAAEKLGKSRTVDTLRAASPVFEEAVRQVLARHGQVIVHRGLAILRVEDVGLRALLGRRFAPAVRELAGAYLAVLPGHLDELLALTRKEGYAVRRIS